MVEPERYYCLECNRDQVTPKPCIRCNGFNVIVAQGVSGCTRCNFKTNRGDSLGWMAYRRIVRDIESGEADRYDPLVRRIVQIREMSTLKANLLTKLREEREDQALMDELNSS
jgi:hypothetical protein